MVREAHRLGYTEPDPRDDLGGVDVARKALILARGLGWRLDMATSRSRGLYPAEMARLSVAEFLAALPQLDADFRDRVDLAAAEGKVLRYAATIEEGRCRVGPTAVDAASPLGSLTRHRQPGRIQHALVQSQPRWWCRGGAPGPMSQPRACWATDRAGL